MQACEGKIGTGLCYPLEDGDLLPASIERFAEEKRLKMVLCCFVGGIGSGAGVFGPRVSDQMPPECHAFTDRRCPRSGGCGCTRAGENGKIGMHMHAAMEAFRKNNYRVASVPASRLGWWRRQSSMKSPASMHPRSG